MTVILITGILFAAAASLGLFAAQYVCAGVEAHDDGPPPSPVPERMLIVASGVLGCICAARGLPLPAMAIVGLACGLLTAVWAADVTRGIIPDVFTVVPLGAVLLAAGLAGHWEVVVAAVVPAVPFAILAWRSRGIGLGWGDVKLAALGGPMIGMQNALIAFTLSCLVAVVVARLRGAKGQPVAFAPYLASAIAVPLALVTPAT